MTIQKRVPGSPSQVGSKPGDALPSQSTKQLVASRGRGGSNPPPGAFHALFFLVFAGFLFFDL